MDCAGNGVYSSYKLDISTNPAIFITMPKPKNSGEAVFAYAVIREDHTKPSFFSFEKSDLNGIDEIYSICSWDKSGEHNYYGLAPVLSKDVFLILLIIEYFKYLRVQLPIKLT